MAKETKTKEVKKKKGNPVLEDEEKSEGAEETTNTDKAEDTDEADEVAEDTADDAEGGEDAEEGSKTPAKGSKEPKKPLIEREAPKRKTDNDIEASMSKDIKNVKQALEKQPKVRIFIPLGIGEKKGSPSAFESVTINAYRMVLPKGEYVTVPQGVADILEAHYNTTPENTDMGQAFRLDKARTKDGMSTDEALN